MGGFAQNFPIVPTQQPANGGLTWLATLNSYALQWYNTLNPPRQQQAAPTGNLPQGSAAKPSKTNVTNIVVFALLGVAVAFGLQAALKRR